MTSIFKKILVWTLGTMVLSLLGFLATSWSLARSRPGPLDMFRRTQRFQLNEAEQAYMEGGRTRLTHYLKTLDDAFEAEHFLVDSSGMDLVNGVDRSGWLAHARRPPMPPFPFEHRFVLMSEPTDRGRRLLILVDPPPDRRYFLLYYFWIFLLIVALGYLLAVHLAKPLRAMRAAVERFGRGDLSARIGSRRRDEIGDLSRAFDEMAGRIETLLSAERRLLQDVSHELRSPLARLGFAIEIARTAEDREFALNRIKKDVGRLSELVDELLLLTRAEGDPTSRSLEELPLDEVLRELVDDCELEAQNKACSIMLNIHHQSTLMGDRKLLYRALENLIRNAIQYAPAGTLIEVELRRDAGLTTITIRDFGAGVPDELLDSIFEPFFRVGDDRSRSSGGVGLGLAIARRAIDLNAGKIHAKNVHPGLMLIIEFPDA